MTIPARSLMAACTVVFLSAGMLPAQTANQSSAQSPYYGSVTIVQPTDGVKPLTLDEAIGMGIEHNLALVEARQQEQSAKAQSLESLQPLLPTVTAQADSGAHQINLAALGFSTSVLGKSAALFPGFELLLVSHGGEGKRHRRHGELLPDPLQPGQHRPLPGVEGNRRGRLFQQAVLARAGRAHRGQRLPAGTGSGGAGG